MSDIDDCASQEIDASDSSISTKNSKKYSFVQSILNANQSQNLCGNGNENILLGNRGSILLPPGKQEFINNWILTHGNNVNLSPIWSSGSPLLGTLTRNSPAKRSANSKIFDYQRKRVCRDIDAKENIAFSTSGQSIKESSSDETIVTIENEKSQNAQSAIFTNISNNDTDITRVNSIVLNGNNCSAALNTSGISRAFIAGKTSSERRSLIIESAKISKTLSLSSPLGNIGSVEINKRNAKQLHEEKNNGGRSKISVRHSGIAREKSLPIKTIKIDRDKSKLRKNVTSSSPFMANGNTSLEETDREIEKHDIPAQRLSSLRGKNISIKFESSLTPNNSNRQSPVRRSSKLIDTGSSTLCESDRIDVESSIPAEEEMKIESDSDDTRSDIIESVETQNLRIPLTTKNICKIEKIVIERRLKNFGDLSCDSDETYYSDADLVPSVPSSGKYSQRISHQKSDILISQVTSPRIQNSESSVDASSSQQKSDILISQVASPLRKNCEDSDNVTPLNTSSDSNKKKKKAKKGSLLAKLQSLVHSQVSNLHIWRYQMSQMKFKGSHAQFVTLRVLERETRWRRNYITASVIADYYNLLNSLFVSQSNTTNRKGVSSRETRIVTLMIVPEITGAIKIKGNSTLNIYPPWDIMHRERRILNVMYFEVISNVANDNVNETKKNHYIERIVQKFDCPCIRSNAIVENCAEKFSDGKPNAMQALFGTMRFRSFD